LAVTLSVLNLIAVAFASAEFVIGVTAFFPDNQINKIIYMSNDVGGKLRIPATFANAHTHAGTMVLTIPWLLGALNQKQQNVLLKTLFAGALVAAMLGVFMSATRTGFLAMTVMIVAATLSGRMGSMSWTIWIAVLLMVGYFIANESRFQRFLTLGDTEMVTQRIEGSVSMHFFELLAAYPLGNGMGAGGTSIPSFLQHLVREPVGLENEYSRILLEEGIPGLALWIGFAVWFAMQKPIDSKDPWMLTRFAIWVSSVYTFLTALTGLGMMTAIPNSMLFMLGLGFVVGGRGRRISLPQGRPSRTKESAMRYSPPVGTPLLSGPTPMQSKEHAPAQASAESRRH
jgi:hypothetical protein